MLKRFCPTIDWKQSFLLSAFVHSLGLSSLLAMSVPSTRSLVFRQGKNVVESVVIVASLSQDASIASDAISISYEPTRVVEEDSDLKEPSPLEALDLDLPIDKNRSIAVSTFNILEASELTIEDVRHPLPTNRPPSYPLFELQNGIEGRVVLPLTVEPDGRVSAVEIEESSGVEGLDRAASAAVSKWLFEPLVNIMDSKPESLLAPITFKIKNQ